MAGNFDKAVTGFNHNIKHKGKVYHVQTEDSGVKNPHIITHLFVGGNILASKKTSYADILNAENLPDVVRELMEEQHKEMLRNLINGVYDNINAARDAKSYQPGELGKDGEGKHHIQPAAAAVAPVITKPAAPVAAAPIPLTPIAPKPIPLTQLVPATEDALPPEVVAARQLKVEPKINEVGVETLFGEDLISEKSLDEVILSYLAGDDGAQ